MIRSQRVALDATSGHRNRSTVPLREKSKKRLLAYVMAAGAPGNIDLKGLLARAVPVGAISLCLTGGGADLALANTIVYTPADIAINPVCILSGGCGSGESIRRGSLAIDLNKDGVNDFNFVQLSRLYFDFDRRTLNATGLGSNGVAKGPNGALALSKGAPIGNGLNFGPGSLMAGTLHNFYPIGSQKSQYLSGSWINVDRYLGLEFQLGGSTHFGWAEFNVQWGPVLSLTATLEGYAYNTVAGQSLDAGQTSNAPEPGTLGLLALGSLGLGFWRRRQAVTAKEPETL